VLGHGLGEVVALGGSDDCTDAMSCVRRVVLWRVSGLLAA
jgi:hypothetical protein